MYIGPLNIKLIIQEDEDDEGTVDSLLHIKPYLKTDFLLLSCDLIFNYPFKPIADMFRLERPAFLAVFHKDTNAVLDGNKSPQKMSSSPDRKMISILSP